jgi:glycolate oxidase FAD binding subunit
VRVVEPATADEVADIVRQAAAGRERIVICGSGRPDEWPFPADADVLLSSRRLNRLVAHRHGDLTVTVEAGARLADVNRELARHNQWIPLDPPWADEVTIGGIVATNASGPRRHRYGAPRDLIIGVEMVRADGVRAKAGGIVVKNVAGYDLSRLLTGSFGCLAVITAASFKLYPRPQASRTVMLDVPSSGILQEFVAAIDRAQLTPTSVEVQAPPPRALVRFESIEASVTEQSARLREIAATLGLRAAILDAAEAARAWASHSLRPWAGTGAVVGVSCLPAELAATLDAIAAVVADGEVVGRAGIGALLVRIDGDGGLQRRSIDALRQRIPTQAGSVIVRRASREVAQAVGVWGSLGSSLRVMQSLRKTFDPRDTLNRSVWRSFEADRSQEAVRADAPPAVE